MLRQVARTIKSESSRNVHTTACTKYFFEKNNKRGLKPLYDRPMEVPEGFFKQSQNSLKMLKGEFKKLGRELYDKFTFSENVIIRSGEVDVIHRFNPNPECLDNWIISTDKDYNMGYSTAKLELSPSGTAIFSGFLDTTVPKDGKQVVTGYATMHTVPRTKSFFRQDPYEWNAHSHMVFRVRGDGRTYNINLSAKQTFDMTFFDVYSYFLYTRGGPYWQFTKVPFSKFIFNSKGTIQDQQGPFMRSNINRIGISLADRKKGPFRLEIDYIGVMLDESETYEEHAYETYKFERPIA